MKKCTLLFFIITLNNFIYSQALGDISAKADSLYSIKSYFEAGNLYEIGGKSAWLDSQRKNLYYNAACSYSLAGNIELSFKNLKLAIKNGYLNKQHLTKDSDLINLHKYKKWGELIKSIGEKKVSTNPFDSKLVTTDIEKFYKTLDLALKDSLNATRLFKRKYFLNGSDGLQDFFASKIQDVNEFSNYVLKNKSFYKSIQPTLVNIKDLKKEIIDNFVKLKSLYPNSVFPDIYFVIGKRTSNGTVSDNGLLIGAEVMSKTPENSKNWNEKLLKWTMDFNQIPITTTHEIIHFNQKGMKSERTLLKYALIEGSAEFIAEIITGRTDGEYHSFIGREKAIWQDFKNEMHQDIYNDWLEGQEPKRPRNSMYWAGYLICKSYYEKAKDKKQAISEILNIKNYTDFYIESEIDEYINNNF